jgi:hypothetical protein
MDATVCAKEGAMDLQTTLTGVSLAGASFSTATTIYYWFMKVRGERPKLSCELSDREIFLGSMTEQTRQLGLKLGLVVANGSVLPNAVLGVRLWVKGREGDWLEADKVTLDKATSRPINLPAMQTAYLVVNGTLTLPMTNELEQQGSKTLAGYAERYLTNPREIKVELKGLNGKTFTSIVEYETPS